MAVCWRVAGVLFTTELTENAERGGRAPRGFVAGVFGSFFYHRGHREGTEKAPRRHREGTEIIRGFAWHNGCVLACRRRFLTTELTENTERGGSAPRGFVAGDLDSFFYHRGHREDTEKKRGFAVHNGYVLACRRHFSTTELTENTERGGRASCGFVRSAVFELRP